MGERRTDLPHWSWDELETALHRFSPTAQTDEVLESLLVETMNPQRRLSREDLLHEILCLGWLMAQAGASATDRLPPASFASSSSPPWLS